MLKLLDAAQTFNFFQNTKCAEVFCQNEEQFSIVCIFCELKLFDFGDFLLHFKNVHLKSSASLTNFQHEYESNCTASTSRTTVEGKAEQLKVDANKIEQAQFRDTNAELLGDEINASEHPMVTQLPLNIRDEEDEDYEDRVGSEHDIDTVHIGMLVQERTKELRCSVCNKVYKLKKMLEQHIKKCHSSDQSYKCPRCGSEFKQKCALNAHMQKEHAGFPCDQCDKTYKSKEALATHRFNHTGVRKFVCDITDCGKAFFNPKQLCSHKRVVHIAERNFVCEVCGFRTKNKSALVVHKRSHTGERPFKCGVCGKGFASQSLLGEHKPIHSIDRPHKCDVCGRTFSRPKALYHHKPLHLDIKKFVCKVCGKAYAQAAGLSGHIRQHKIEHSALLDFRS